MIRTFIEAIHDRWANLHFLVRGLVLLAAAAVIGFVFVSGPYQRFKSWRMERNLLAARNAVSEQSMHDARDLSLTVLRADASCLEAFRILEKATASLRDPWHGEIARALMAHPEGSDEDRLNCFRGIAPEVALGLLGQAWTTLPDANRQDPRFAVVFADRLIAEHRLNEAVSVLLAVPAATRTPAVDQRLIRVLIRSGKRQGFDEAQRLIAAGFPTDGRDISGWLGLLEEIPAVSLRADLLEPVRKLLAKPPDGAAARIALMLVRIDYATNFTNCTPILEKAISRWKDRDPEALAGFLKDLGLYQLLLDSIPVASVGEHPGLFPLMLEAIERRGAWDQAAPLLDAHGRLLPKFEELAHRALVATRTGDVATHTKTWTDAMGEAKISPAPDAFLTLHRIARDAAMRGESEQALVEAIRCGRGPLPLYEDLKPLLGSLAQRGLDKILLEICAIYLPLEAGNPVLITQLAYLASLNQLIEPKTVLAAMELLAKGFPDEVPIHCVLATALLCAGENAKAAETLDRLQLDPAKLAPGYRAVYLTTEVLNHRIDRNDALITGFPWKSLLPSERRKFSELIRTAEM